MNLTIVINVCFNISLIRNNFEFSNDYDNDFQIHFQKYKFWKYKK